MIEGLSDDEKKSVMLSRLCGWESNKVSCEYNRETNSCWTIYTRCGTYIWRGGLYPVRNMFHAWRVLNWVHENNPSDDRFFSAFYSGNAWWDLFGMSPCDAIRAMLDTVLELATEAGMIETK